MTDFQKRIVIGIEVESYSIDISDYKINRRVSKPKPSLSENGERFLYDTSIGSEYNSKPFTTIREALFLLKSGLRKYLRKFYVRSNSRRKYRNSVPLLVGTWTDRVAGMHMHISIADRVLSLKEARSLSWHLHDYIPFFIAVSANSPVIDRRLNTLSSNRIYYGSRNYFSPIRRNQLNPEKYQEIVYNCKNRTKPSTLELRIFDSNIPEFMAASICLVKAACLKWLKGEKAENRVSHGDYLEGRMNAARQGMKADLPWKKEWLPASKYLDRFLWEHRHIMGLMEVPGEIFEIFKILKAGVTGASIIHDSVQVCQRKHPVAWEKYFAKNYDLALQQLLSGNSVMDFAKILGFKLPSLETAWLGRKNTIWIK